MMRIVVLDGYTLNPGDLSWECFEHCGEVTVYERTPDDLILERAKDADIILTNKTPLTSQTIASLPSLRYVGVLATGYNVVDVESAVQRGITVTNIPLYGTNSVAQMTFALLLELCHHVQEHSDAVHSGKWSKINDFCFWNHPLIELSEKTMGIIGFGRIGRQVGQIAAVLGMRIVAANNVRLPKPDIQEFQWMDIDGVLAESDFVSLHCPLTSETNELINRRTIEKMRSSAFLINTSRGGLVNEEDLANALNNDRLAGAALDVLSVEPPSPDNPMLSAKNCLITPHIAWATHSARQRLMITAAKNLEAYISSHPINVVT